MASIHPVRTSAIMETSEIVARLYLPLQKPMTINANIIRQIVKGLICIPPLIDKLY